MNRDDASVTILAAVMERRPSVAVFCVHISSSFNKNRDDAVVTILAAVMERRRSPVVFRVHIRPRDNKNNKNKLVKEEFEVIKLIKN